MADVEAEEDLDTAAILRRSELVRRSIRARRYVHSGRGLPSHSLPALLIISANHIGTPGMQRQRRNQLETYNDPSAFQCKLVITYNIAAVWHVQEALVELFYDSTISEVVRRRGAC